MAQTNRNTFKKASIKDNIIAVFHKAVIEAQHIEDDAGSAARQDDGSIKNTPADMTKNTTNATGIKYGDKK